MKIKSLIAVALLVAVRHAQSSNAASPYSALYAFGHSWTATRDTICGWGPPRYYQHQACNGTMWPEFLSTNLGLVYIATNNLAQCGADSGVTLNQVKQLNIGTNAALALYFLWADGEFLYGASTGSLPTRTIPYIPWTNDVAWDQLILTAINNNSNAVEQLYTKGARSIVVQNNFDLSTLPFVINEFGTNQARTLKLRERTTRFNLALTAALDAISGNRRDLRLMTVDIQGKLNDLLTNAAAYGFTKTFPAALDDTSLSDKSFTDPGKDYVFWDSLHATSKAQSLIAAWNLEALGPLTNGFGPPTITVQPRSQTNVIGSAVTLSVEATGVSPLFYQWRRSSAEPGATNAVLVLTNLQSVNAGNYTVVISNVEGAVTSAVALVRVLLPPTITAQPSNQTASVFADATFRMTASGTAPLSYQWRFNDSVLLGMTNATLTVTNVQRTNVGSYGVVVTNLGGSVTSQVATLAITPFNSIYAFGFSWTDTHNCSWNATRYYQNRACNGTMWPEFVSTNLGLAYVAANNYAKCSASSLDILNQVINFPVPPKPQLSLYFLWATYDSAPAVTNEAAWNQVIQPVILNYSNTVDRLYLKGARQIVVETEFDLSKFPTLFPDELILFGTNSAGLAVYGEFMKRFNAAFLDAMNAYSQSRPDLRILTVDIFSKLNEVLANPTEYGFTKTSIDALGDTTLTDKSFTGPGADYVFWDWVHGTSKLNKLMTAWHLEALTNSILERLDLTIASGSPTIQMNRLQIGRDYTLQKSADLRTWSDVQTFTAVAGTNQWVGASTGATVAFYRLKWQP